jgi:AcrR family transcriptional regulator
MGNDVKTRRGLTTERVVDGALEVADADGIESLSLRRLAASLAVTPMAIYRHVRNKAHLLDLMAERLLEQVDIAADGTISWQERLRRLFGSYLAVAAAHPAAPFLLSRPFTSAREPQVTEALFEAFHDAGLDARQSGLVMQVISGMVLGPALHRAAWAAAMREVATAGPQDSSTDSPSAQDFPHSSVVAPFLDWSASPEADRLTLDLLISGLEAFANPTTSRSGMERRRP